MANIADKDLLDYKQTIAPQFHLTHECNLNCPGCYMMHQYENRPSIIPSEDIDFYMRQFSAKKSFNDSVCFSGGEMFSLPTEYLKYNIQNALRGKNTVYLKTNGSWVDGSRSSEIFNMLKNLKVHTSPYMGDYEMDRVISHVEKTKIPLAKQEYVISNLVKKNYSYPALLMDISVDNKIHPGTSADWFLKIVNTISNDAQLSNNVTLRAISFADLGCWEFVQNKIFRLSEQITEIGNNHYAFTINGMKIFACFGIFVDMKEKAENDNTPLSVDGLFVYYFHPNKTVCISSETFKSMGVISYIDENGKYKDLDRIRREITQKIKSEQVR